MKKIFQIGMKDLLVTFRDRAALILMLLAPFILTLALGAISGSFGGTDTADAGIDPIPLIVVNQDQGTIGLALVDILTDDTLSSLVDTLVFVHVADAQAQVDNDKVTAAVIIPPNFTSSIIPDSQTGALTDHVDIEIYGNAGRAISVSIIEAVVSQFMSQVDNGIVSVELIVTQLITSGRITPQEAPAFIQTISQGMGEPAPTLITLNSVTATGTQTETGVDFLAIMAPGMAIFFLMYTVTLGGYSLLNEWQEHTIPRILTTPTTISQILAGKMVGTILTGLTQMSILIISCALLFRLNWGNPLAVALLILSAVLAATGWGMFLAAFADTPTQVATLGTAMMLLFGMLGGNFTPDLNFSGVMAVISHLTPNAWAMEGFSILANGGQLSDISSQIGALFLMAIVLYVITSALFRRRWG